MKTDAPLDVEARLEIERRQRALLSEDLVAGRTQFRARPQLAYIPFSNFCNMACTMCYDGVNPPLVRIPPEVLARVASELFPTLSYLAPFGASEPLILTWDETRDLAREHALKLDLVTNVQFLDEAKFDELKDVTRSICFSIDSHDPDVYARIRLKSNPKKVFRNLPVAARLCREHGIDFRANVVFLAENGAAMADTVAWLADQGVETVHVLEFHDNGGYADAEYDGRRAFSEDEVASIRDACLAVARDKSVRLWWGPGGWVDVDHRAEIPATPEREREHDAWVWRLRHRSPGFCEQVAYRIRVDLDGEVYPCCRGGNGDLALGPLTEKSFADIYNGPAARDLRRAMYTADLPALCVGCDLRLMPPVEGDKEFTLALEDEHPELRGVARSLEITGPTHLARSVAAPALELRVPDEVASAVSAWQVVLSLGATSERLLSFRAEGATPRIDVPGATWSALPANAGVWYAVWACDAAGRPIARTTEVRCLIRHEPLPRVEGSTLRYPERSASPAF